MGLFNSKVVPFFPNAQQFGESAMPQQFSLPMPIMKYIWENVSSPEVYEKLTKCCKLFFIKNPILVMKMLKYERFYEWRLYYGKECIHHYCNCNYEQIKMDKVNGKIWVSKKLDVKGHYSDWCWEGESAVSDFIPKIFRYNVEIFNLTFQHLSYDELKFLSTGVKEIRLFSNIVKYDNGQMVFLEYIMELFSGAQKIFLYQPNNSVKNYDDFIEACNPIKEVEIDGIVGDFNIREFYQRLKKSKNRAVFRIYSGYEHPKIVQEILETVSFEFVPPVIKYQYQDEQDFKKMKEIQAREAAKYR